MTKMIKVYARTNMNGSDVHDSYEAPENWDSMTSEEQQQFLDEAAETHLSNCVDYGAYVEED